jgi:hypothetical protein
LRFWGDFAILINDFGEIDYLYEHRMESKMDVGRATYFLIATEDRPGQLARFSKRMMEHEINLAAVWCFGTGRGNAEILAIPRESSAFKKVAREAGWAYREGSCFHLTGEDRAGALADTLDRIAQEGINLHAVDAMGFETRYSAYVWCDEEDVEKLRKVLKGW